MLTVLAFVLALGVLVAVHEYGHYRVAVACGVKVLRFSIGFGQTLYAWKPRRQRPGQDTEFLIGAFPLGGYVRMLDEREGPVAAEERHRAFNTQPLKVRAAIVAAGPVANILLAILLYSVVNWTGVEEPQPVLGSPVVGSIAERAGLHGGERVQQAGFAGESMTPVRSFEELRWLLTRGALDGRDVQLALAGESSREVLLPLSRLNGRDADPRLFSEIGLLGPWTQPLIRELQPGGAGERAGLHAGDLVRSIGGVPVGDGQQLRDLIRKQVSDGKPVSQAWQVQRDGRLITLQVTPSVFTPQAGCPSLFASLVARVRGIECKSPPEAPIARIEAYVGSNPEMVVVRHGPVQGLWKGVTRTWEISELTARMMGRMLIGHASIKNISGPLTIADFAGKSAALGPTQYLLFLALISVSLGVLNLLPIPVLDGGHLMYYLWEAVTGRSVSDIWMERLQRAGVAVLLVMMSIALFNDVTRIFG